MKLKNAVEFRAGGTPDTGNESFWANGDVGTPWVAIGDMSGGPIVSTTAKRLTPEGLAARGLAPGGSGTVLFAMYASVGAVATLNIDAVWNQAILGMTPTHDTDGRFVAYWLRHYGPQAVADARSATQANLNADQVANFPFPDWKIEEQRRIADFLDEKVAHIDRIIAARQRQLALTELHRASDLVAYVFKASDDMIPCRAVAEVRLGRQRSPQHEAGEHMVPYLRSANVSDGEFDLDDVKTMNFSLSEQGIFELRSGDVLVTEGSASPSAVGASAAWAEQLTGPICFQNTLIRLRGREECDAEFLEVWARASHAAGAARNWSSGAGILHLGSEGMSRMLIPRISFREQRSRANAAKATLEAHGRLRDELGRSLNAITEFKRSLITAAVTGELDVTTGGGIPG